MAEDRNDNAVAEMEARLNKLEYALQDKYSSIGKVFLALAESENKAVNDLVDEIIETRQKISQVKGEISCHACMRMNAPDSRFCTRCGAALPQKNDEKENDYGHE